MSNDPIISVVDLQKTYRVHEREAGAGASFGSLFKRKYKDVRAVEGVSFDLQPGEVVGFLGPNGAGKTTTLKMLAGLLHPTGGTASVMGFTPWKRSNDYLRNISLVMGNRNQLIWDIPAMDSFLVNQAIYEIPETQFRQTLSELIELLELGELIKKPVRGLSLGERMKCELAAALLHLPKVLFLDEPTLGVDVTMQGRIRQFVHQHNEKHGATVLLTSHYMADVTALCSRVIVIHHGKLLYDGDLSKLADRMSPLKLVKLDVENIEDVHKAEALGHVSSIVDNKVTLRVPRAEASALVARALTELSVIDLTVEDPPIEEVIDQIFQGANVDDVAAPSTEPAITKE
ncbi:MAG: ATP-binding cassette domain-containing protein [Chthonomonadales bacterium]